MSEESIKSFPWLTQGENLRGPSSSGSQCHPVGLEMFLPSRTAGAKLVLNIFFLAGLLGSSTLVTQQSQPHPKLCGSLAPYHLLMANTLQPCD